MSQRLPGQVIGRAGGGLEEANAGWAANADVARVGRAGELATARVLDEWASRPGGPSVLHDLTIPGSRANVDHVVVSGTRLLLVDSKVWKPGLYWSAGGRVFRGAHRFVHAEKKTMEMAADRLAEYVARFGLHVQVAAPVTAVWSSSTHGSVHLVLLRLAGLRTLHGQRLSPRLAGRGPADQRVVQVLAALCASARPAPVPTPRRGPSRSDAW